MKERLLIILAVAVLTLAAAPALSSLLPAGSSTAGSPGVVHGDPMAAFVKRRVDRGVPPEVEAVLEQARLRSAPMTAGDRLPVGHPDDL